MEEKFDAIVVGAGPAGATAALVMARAGLNVVVLERGDYPGAKNVMGGILFSTILNKLIPNFWGKAPVERFVRKRKFCLLSEESSLCVEIDSQKYKNPPFNNSFTVLRAKFDQWYASMAEEAGAFVIPQTVVDDFIWKDNKIAGVKTRREEGDLYSDVVIVADGANSLLAAKANMREEFVPEHFIVGVKEVMELPPEVINERFNVKDKEGSALEFFGGAVKGLVGSGFIYTNKDSLSVGLGVSIKSAMTEKVKPSDLLEDFKNHPAVSDYLEGAKTTEYAAHLIPEIGYKGLPKLYRDNVMLAGDSAGLVNFSLYHEGTNLAMASGMMAAETVIEAKKKEDFSASTLSLYKEKLENSFVLKDLRKYQNVPDFMEKKPEFFGLYPRMAADLASDFFLVDEKPKAERQDEIFKKFKEQAPLFKFALDMWAAKKALL